MQRHSLDRDTLPFSEAEFYEGFRLILSDKKAREAAAFIVELVGDVADQTQRARLARAQGSLDPAETAIPGLVIPDDVFALLALVSGELRVRVDDYIRARWEADRPGWLRDGLYRPGGVILREPTPEVYSEVEARMVAAAGEWQDLLEKTHADVERRRRRRP